MTLEELTANIWEALTALAPWAIGALILAGLGVLAVFVIVARLMVKLWRQFFHEQRVDPYSMSRGRRDR